MTLLCFHDQSGEECPYTLEQRVLLDPLTGCVAAAFRPPPYAEEAADQSGGPLGDPGISGRRSSDARQSPEGMRAGKAPCCNSQSVSSVRATAEPPDQVRHPRHNDNSLLTWSCAKWSGSLHWTTTGPVMVLSPSGVMRTPASSLQAMASQGVSNATQHVSCADCSLQVHHVPN